MTTIKYINNNIVELFKDVNNIKLNKENDSIDTIIDSYEIDNECYNYIIKKSDIHFKIFKNMLETSLKNQNIILMMLLKNYLNMIKKIKNINLF